MNRGQKPLTDVIKGTLTEAFWCNISHAVSTPHGDNSHAAAAMATTLELRDMPLPERHS